MKWIDVQDYYPGDAVMKKILIRLSNGDIHLDLPNMVRGGWYDEVKRKEIYATHWMVIAEPTP